MRKKTLKSSSITYFYIILSMFILLILGFIFFKVDIFLSNRQIEKQNILFNKQNKELTASQLMTGFEKLNAVRQIEEEYQTIPRSEHILKVINMLEDIKNIDNSDSEIIVLYDFKITLDEVSFKGKVSRLRLLYYTNKQKRITALFDKFNSLGFLEDIHIQNYKKTDGGFEFTLHAKVVNNGGEG